MKALVTRPEADAAPLGRALAARGIEAVLAPMLSIVPAADAGPRLDAALIGAQGLLFTSANGVRVFAAASKRRELPVFAVGDASAAAARLANFRSVASADGDVADLAALVEARLAPGNGPLVHVAGREVAGDLAGRLGAAGFTVRVAAIYDAVPASALEAATQAALRHREVAWALFFSPRTAATFARLVAAAALTEACRSVIAIALSPAVATALAALSWRALHVAAAPTQASLLTALDAARGEARER